MGLNGVSVAEALDARIPMHGSLMVHIVSDVTWALLLHLRLPVPYILCTPSPMHVGDLVMVIASSLPEEMLCIACTAGTVHNAFHHDSSLTSSGLVACRDRMQ